ERPSGPRPAARRHRAASAFLQRARQSASGEHGGEDAEDDPRENGEREREPDDRAVDADGVEAGEAPPMETPEERHAPRSEQDAEAAAYAREDHTFGEELSYQAAAAGAERGPHGELRLTRGRAREQQVRHVRARDQEDERDGAEQDQHRRSNVA